MMSQLRLWMAMIHQGQDAQWFFGVKAPVLIWSVSVALFVVTVVWIAWFLVSSLLVLIRTRSLRNRLSKLVKQIPSVKFKGWASDEIEAARKVFGDNRRFKSLWELFESGFIRIEHGSGERSFAGTDPASVFSFDNVIGRYINLGFWGSVPTLLTGAGLTFTFIAILMALMNLRVDPTTHVVGGIDELINGLSGKFLSSVVALLCAMIFSLIEKTTIHWLEVGHLDLINEVASGFPRETTEKALARVERHIAEQTLSFKNFDTDLSARLKDSFTESMGPTLKNMVDTLNNLCDSQEGLNSTISGLARGAEEDMGKRIELLVKQLEASLVEAFRGMSNELRSVFVQSAGGQFDLLAQEISKTASLLGSLNQQSELHQQAMERTIQELKSSAGTTAQQLSGALQASMEQFSRSAETLTAQMGQAIDAMISKSASHAEASENAMRQMIQELKSATGSTLQNVTQTLQDSLKGFKDSAAFLSQQMESNLSSLAQKSSEHSEQVMAKANATIELASKATTGITDAWSSLEGASETLKGTMSAFSGVIHSMKETSASWSGMQQGLAAATNSVEKTLQEQSKMAGDLMKQIGSLAAATARSDETAKAHESILQKYRTILEGYNKVFLELDKSIARVMQEIDKDMRTYQSAIHEGLESLAEAGDKYFTNISEKLKDTIETLNESLGDFSDVLEKTRDGKGTK